MRRQQFLAYYQHLGALFAQAPESAAARARWAERARQNLLPCHGCYRLLHYRYFRGSVHKVFCRRCVAARKRKARERQAQLP